MQAPRLSIGLGSFLVALALVVAVGIGSAIAVIPNQGTCYACLTKSSGPSRSSTTPRCSAPRAPASSSGTPKARPDLQGPQGVEGPKGDQGPKEDQGPAGPADWNAISNRPAGFADGVDDQGVTGLTITRIQGPYTQVYANASGTAWGQAHVDCPAGSRVVGGGYWSPTNAFAVNSSTATDAGHVDRLRHPPRQDGQRWVSAIMRADVLCLRVEPGGALTVAAKTKHPKANKVRRR